MKDIGNKLKEKREENGVSVEEAALDLQLKPSQIINLESGDREDFKDVITLKKLISDYAKYLGLDVEKMLDELNEYLFDLTSKIPLDKVEEATKNIKIEKEFTSPYTKIPKKKNNYLLIVAIIIILITIIGCLFYAKSRENQDLGKTTYNIGGK